jgi:hypothetical protein
VSRSTWEEVVSFDHGVQLVCRDTVTQRGKERLKLGDRDQIRAIVVHEVKDLVKPRYLERCGKAFEYCGEVSW